MWHSSIAERVKNTRRVVCDGRGAGIPPSPAGGLDCEVDEIIDLEVVDGQLYYQVHWKGDNTKEWKLALSMENCDNAIRRYEERAVLGYGGDKDLRTVQWPQKRAHSSEMSQTGDEGEMARELECVVCPCNEIEILFLP